MVASGQGMSIQLIGDVAGVQRMISHLDTALNPVAIATFLGGVVAPYLGERAESRFSNEGDDVVGRWAPLQASTEMFREQGRNQGLWGVGDAHPINVRTHELELYITSGVGNTTPTPSGAILQYPNPSAGSSRSLREKMKTAQQGRQKPRTVPRPVIGLNERDMTFVLMALATSIQKAGRP